ncbi:MAG: hypothetical protein B0D92_03590 [Spirochaeta sp. LUC14_002_19_P3]|nr:MAG: hypothetical protein B0D92_03590 [Spirochaeta sp. LUC14_002_19_P3]
MVSMKNFVVASGCIALLIAACSSNNKSGKTGSSPPSGTGSGRNMYWGRQIPANDITVMKQHFSIFGEVINLSNDSNYLYVHSFGIPSHNMMRGISSWNQQVPLPQAYIGDNAWPVPLKPKLAEYPKPINTNFMRGAIALAVNGVPIFNPLNNRGEDAHLIGELDEWGGHSGRADDYHYHLAPVHLADKTHNGPIAYALDGFPIYGMNEPDGSPAKDLDDYHGHFYEDSYHYHADEEFPYFIGFMVGEVETENPVMGKNSDPPGRGKINPGESSIIPQPRSTPIREAAEPLHGAIITDFKRISERNFTVYYSVPGKESSTYQIDYSWDEQQRTYHFVFKKNNSQIAEEVYTKRHTNGH